MNRVLLLILFVCVLPITVSAQTPRYARVISQNANLRDTPSPAGAVGDEVPEGTLVKVLDEKLPWYVVRVANHVGWMHGNTIEFISALGSTPQPTIPQAIVPEYTPPPTPLVSPSAVTPETPQHSTPTQATTNHTYLRGSRGGCYYLSGSGRKVYVDRGLCN
ncbi:MAG: hypothetical protein QOD75_122 [Blastocatellia bacterium]|jgi:hypothetical protein|nr:hypothetical protein [Blastocatellia bacterium]